MAGFIRTLRTRAGCLLVFCAISCAHAPAPSTAPEKAHKDQQFTEFFRRSSGWISGDGALSIPLLDGRVLWLFGDSHVDDLAGDGTTPCLFQVRNAGLVQTRGDFKNARTLTGQHRGFRSLFKNAESDDTWFWPVCGFQNRDKIYVYLAALRKTAAGGMWGFESVGHDAWGILSFPDLKVIRYIDLPPFNGIGFGNGFVRERDGYTYAFGGKQKGITSDVYVARFKSPHPEAPWTFWDGKDWNADVTQAMPIAKGASTSVHVCKVRGKFLLATSEFSIACDQGKTLFIATSESPAGPFSPLKPIFTVDDTVEGHRPFFYLPSAHPEFINGEDEILITYSINGYEPCIPACKNGRANPDHYRPKAIRVPLSCLNTPASR